MKVLYDSTTGKILANGENPEPIAGSAEIILPDDTVLENYSLINGVLALDTVKEDAYKNRTFKNTARVKIETDIGDDKDLVADLSKKVSMLTRLVTRFFNEQYNNTPMDATIKAEYLQMVSDYIAGVDAGVIKDRGDLEDNSAMFSKLISRDTQIANIVNDEYLSKKI